ncbi:hypothetical protein Tco_0793938 [Tanacetum coccineum]
MVNVINGVLASGVDINLEKDFVCFALQKMEIHLLMFLIQTLSMIFQIFSTTLHNPNMNHTRASYVEMIPTIAANISTHTPEPLRRFNSFYDDDDYEESTIPLNEIDSQIPPSIAIIPDEFIKSSVEDLVPILSESEDTSGSDSDLPFDDESLSDEDIPEDNVKIYSNPLFEFDDEYISSDVNPLFDEVLENIERGKIDEIDAFLDMDISTDIENGYHDSEGDIIYLESLLNNNTIPNLPPEDFLDYEDSRAHEIPSGESKVHIEVLSVLWGNRLLIPDGSLPLSW